MPAIPTAAGAKKAVAGSGAGVGAGAAGVGAGAAGGTVGASSGACCGASATAGGGGAAAACMLEENPLVLFHGNKAGSFLGVLGCIWEGVDPFRFPWFVKGGRAKRMRRKWVCLLSPLLLEKTSTQHYWYHDLGPGPPPPL